MCRPPFDALPGGGLTRGGFFEICGRPSSGSFSLSLAALAEATGKGELAALIDLGDELEPRCGEAAGIDMSRLLWLRPRESKKALVGTELLLHTGFSLVILSLGADVRSFRRYPAAVWVRIARAASHQQGCAIVLSPRPILSPAAEASIHLDRARTNWLGKMCDRRLLNGLSLQLSVRSRKGPRREIHRLFRLHPGSVSSR